MQWIKKNLKKKYFLFFSSSQGSNLYHQGSNLYHQGTLVFWMY